MNDQRVSSYQPSGTPDGTLSRVRSFTPLIIWTTDRLGSITLMEGRGLANLPGKSVGSVGRPIFDFLADYPQLQQNIRRGLAGEEVISTVEFGGLSLDAHCAPLKDTDGKVIGMIGVAADTSERRMAGDQYRTLARNLPSIVYRVFQREGCRMEFFNEMFESITGYEPAEIGPGEVCCIDPLIDPRDREGVIRQVREAVERNEPFVVQYRLKGKNGLLHHLLERGRPVRGFDGKPLYIDGVIFDVTESVKAQESVAIQRDLAFSLAGTLTLNAALDLCLKTALQISEMECGGIYVVNEPGHLILVASIGLSERFMEEASHYGPDTVNWQLVSAGEPIYSRLDDLHLPHAPWMEEERIKCVAIIPVVHKEKLVACLNIGSRQLEEFSPLDRISLEALSAHIGGAINRLQIEEDLRAMNAAMAVRTTQLRGLASELTMAEHHERHRLAQILHDDLQQILVAAKFRVSPLLNSEQEAVRESAMELDNLLNNSIEISRSLIGQLSPPILRQRGLVRALEWLCRWIREKYNLGIDRHRGGGRPPTPATPPCIRVRTRRFERLR